MPVFYSDLSQTPFPLPHVWQHTVGSGHAPLALRADWQAQLHRSHQELGFQHVRFHDLLSDQMGTLVCQAEEKLYSFFNADQIWDFLLSIGMRPFVELSFMPTALASGRKTVFHYQANITPPKDYKAWGELIHKLVSHWVERYGRDEVRHWFFEVWNEPNLDAFWTGNQADYFKLYRHTAEAIKAVDPSLRVGGPATAQNKWIADFLDFCHKHDLPADFITTHHYPTDALGSADMDTETQLAKSRRSFLREQAQDARRQAGDKPLYYTEWNSSSNPRDPLHDASYAAAFVTKTNLEAAPLVEGYSFWTFSDIFEENYFPSVPFHGGFGLLTIHGIAKPTYRAYELLHRLGDQQYLVDGLHHTVDAWVVGGGANLTVLLTNSALPRHPIQTEKVTVELAQATRPETIQLARIDDDHTNPRRHWQEMGSPDYLSAAQVQSLDEASQLTWERLDYDYQDGCLRLQLNLPPQSVAAIEIYHAGGQS
jgi:xylan 1,4-beta-xylosidase